MPTKLAPLALLLLLAGAAAWIATGTWQWAAYGLLAMVAVATVGAAYDRVRGHDDA